MKKIIIKTKKSNNNNAQGTTEYLIVIAIIVVIGLIVANLSTNLFDQTQILNTNEQLKGTIGSSGISIIDAIADYETEGILNLKNNSGETLTLTKITTEEGTQEYDNEQWVQGNTELININNLCQCETGQTKKTCNFQIEYTTKYGIQKKITQTITVNCQETITTNTTPIQPIDITPPIITLITPENNTNTANKTITFSFNVQDERNISSCTLTTNNDNNTYTEIENGNNSIIYNFQNDFLTDWNISCTDESNNTGYSTTRTLDVDSNAYQITTCLELQDMNLDLDGDYELMNDIDCSTISNFSPIGDCGTVNCYSGDEDPFTGSLNGNYKIITSLNIDTQGVGGLFGYLSGQVRSIQIEDSEVIGNLETGGIAGYIRGTSPSIQESSFNGTVTSTGTYSYAGGLVGSMENGFISESFFDGTLSGNTYVGGIAGAAMSCNTNGTIINCYSLGTITGSTKGGIAGVSSFDVCMDQMGIKNSFSAANVGSSGYGIVANTYACTQNNFWDTDVSGTTNNFIGELNCEWFLCTCTQTEDNSGGKTTLEMYEQSTYQNWDFVNVWQEQENDYPILKWQTE